MAKFPLKFMRDVSIKKREIKNTKIGIFNFPFLDGDIPRRTSYGVYISQFISFARASSNVSDFNCRNKALTAKLLKQGYRYHKLLKAFSKFYHRHSELLKNIMFA